MTLRGLRKAKAKAEGVLRKIEEKIYSLAVQKNMAKAKSLIGQCFKIDDEYYHVLKLYENTEFLEVLKISKTYQIIGGKREQYLCFYTDYMTVPHIVRMGAKKAVSKKEFMALLQYMQTALQEVSDNLQ